MRLRRRDILRLAAGVAALPSAARFAWADTYPARPVRIVVGFAAGATSDIVARLTAQSLSERLGRQFVVENRPGAGGNVGTEVVVRAPPDGYTLLFALMANTINATLYDKLNFNFIRDVAPVAGVARVPIVMVVAPSFPARTIAEFIAYAKANPGKINMASNGNGSAQHVAGELFKMMAGINMMHIAYNGNPRPDLMSGAVQVMFDTLPAAIGFIRAGKLRALAVASAAQQSELPGVPTVAEFVPGYEASAWQGVIAPKNTPDQIIEKLNAAINAGLPDPAMKARLADLGAEPMPMTPAEFGKFIVAETEKWAKVIRAANIKAE